MPITVDQLKGFGAEINGVNLASPISDDVQQILYRLWLEHGVLVFRRQGTDAERHIRLARVFGPLQRHPVASSQLQSNPDLMLLATDMDGTPVQYVDGELRRGFLYWHSDLAYVPEINKGSLLRALDIPEQGGDTGWADTAAAYKDLSTDMKRRLENLFTIQIVRNTTPHPWGCPGLLLRTAPAEEFAIPAVPDGFPPVLQPMVITHQESGIKSLLLSPMSYVRINGMNQAESDELFEEICYHSLQDKYIYRHRWQVGDMVLWDNRRTMHCAYGYPVNQYRQVQRATLAEVQLTGRPYEPSEPVA